jgi:excisionase family DNA binding protein
MDRILKKLETIQHLIEAQVSLQKKILNLEEASRFLGISKSDLYKRTSANQIPFFKPSGKLIFFQREDLENWMLTNPQNSLYEIIENVNNFKLK